MALSCAQCIVSETPHSPERSSSVMFYLDFCVGWRIREGRRDRTEADWKCRQAGFKTVAIDHILRLNGVELREGRHRTCFSTKMSEQVQKT